jgi:hypothetical protein
MSYATHRNACDGVSPLDVKDELGHATLAMRDKVYARARKHRVPMRPELDFRAERWLAAAPERFAAVRLAG